MTSVSTAVTVPLPVLVFRSPLCYLARPQSARAVGPAIRTCQGGARTCSVEGGLSAGKTAYVVFGAVRGFRHPRGRGGLGTHPLWRGAFGMDPGYISPGSPEHGTNRREISSKGSARVLTEADRSRDVQAAGSRPRRARGRVRSLPAPAPPWKNEGSPFSAESCTAGTPRNSMKKLPAHPSPGESSGPHQHGVQLVLLSNSWLLGCHHPLYP